MRATFVILLVTTNRRVELIIRCVELLEKELLKRHSLGHSWYTPGMPKSGQIEGYPEFGELNGEQIPLTWERIRKLAPSQKAELIVEIEGERIRPWRFASQASDYKFG